MGHSRVIVAATTAAGQTLRSGHWQRSGRWMGEEVSIMDWVLILVLVPLPLLWWFLVKWVDEVETRWRTRE